MHPETPRGQWLVVADGDTLDAIAQRAGVPPEDILEANGLDGPSQVHAGNDAVRAATGRTARATAGRRHPGADGAVPLAADHRGGDDRLALRGPLGAPARGDRPSGAGRHAGVRRRRRSGRLRRTRRARLREPDRPQARRRSADGVRAQLGAAGRARAAGARRRSDRAGRPERPRHRSALALRGATRANTDGPDELPAAATSRHERRHRSTHRAAARARARRPRLSQAGHPVPRPDAADGRRRRVSRRPSRCWASGSRATSPS